MTRKRFTERQTLETLLRSGCQIVCYRCNVHFFPDAHGDLGLANDMFNIHWVGNAEREHLTELSLGGKDAPDNCAYSCRHSHKIVTNGTKATSAGSSKQRIAKVKRLQGLTCTGPKKKIQSRGFDNSRKRKWPERKMRFKPKMIIARADA